MATQRNTEPRWHINKLNMSVDVVSGDKVLVSFGLPAVCRRYTGDARDRVMAECAATLREQRRLEFNVLWGAWLLTQPLTEADRDYIALNKRWYKRASEHGVEDKDAMQMHNELTRMALYVSAQGWAASNKARGAK